jgi:hypothetical protein
VWAFAGRRGKETFVVVPGREQGPFEAVGQFIFLGDLLVYVPRTAEGVFVVTGPVRQGPFDEVADLTALGDQLVFSARRGALWQVHAGGLPAPAFDGVSGLTVSGREVLYAGRRGRQDWVVHGGREFGPYHPLKRRLGLSAAGPFFAGWRQGKWWVVRGKTELGPYDEVTVLASAAGRDAFIAQRDRRFLVVRDGVEAASHALAAGLVMSADGQRLMFVAREGQQLLLVVDEVATPYDLILPDTLAFSRDGRHFGFVMGEARTKRLFMRFDDGSRSPVDLEELAAAISRLPLTELNSPSGAVLSRWVEAELALRFEQGSPPDGPP